LSPASGSQSPPGPAATALTGLAGEYFSFLARKFPTLCRHDEFIYFPRAPVPQADWWQVARLEAAAIEAAARQIVSWKEKLAALLPEITDPEAAARAALLRQSMRGVLRELGPGGPWERDPFFYLKVAALAWAPILAGTPPLELGDAEKLTELLAQVARLFAWGAKQIKTLSLPVQILSSAAFADARRFFDEVLPAFFLTQGFPAGKLQPRLVEISRNLVRFQEKVVGLPAAAPCSRGEKDLLEILTQCWGWDKDLTAAAAILDAEIAASLEALANLAAAVKPRRPWTEVLDSLPLPEHRDDLLSLYGREIERLWRFWSNSPVLPRLSGRVEVAPTPVYLRTLRASASYAAPWGPPAETPGYFYVSPEMEDLAHHLRHCPFLSAHETVPGHHFLDTWRLSLPAAMARHYESPLFYEGWACYAETLLLSEGYLQGTPGEMVGWQRRLWRALRGQVDLELQRGRWDLEEGCRRLGLAGYPPGADRIQILQLALNPGYQLCYTLGLKEILHLREEYAPFLGLARFHQILLDGGQLPFSWVEKRLQAQAA
jgi:hypothetical protein